VDFPYIPKPHIRRIFTANNGLYAPTYLFLVNERKQSKLPYAIKSTASRVPGKGKARNDPEFDKEKQWLLLKLQEDATENDAQVAEEANEQEYADCGDGIECGCCFSNYPFVRLFFASVCFRLISSNTQDKMIQCPDAHLFCHSCMKSYADTLLGSHDANVICMDQSGCKLPFTESELKRFGREAEERHRSCRIRGSGGVPVL
jgi:TRIAD3 protein (E3 ubiquitin-protein ligase RNF216)